MKKQTIKDLIFMTKQRIERRTIHKFFQPNCKMCERESQILQELKDELISHSKSKASQEKKNGKR